MDTRLEFCIWFISSKRTQLESEKKTLKMGYCNDILKEFMENSSLHGVKFLIDEKISFMERMFWLASIVLSWIGSGFLIASALDAFHHNAISFVVETSYRDWTTHFPSVIVCESKNNDKIQAVADAWAVFHSIFFHLFFRFVLFRLFWKQFEK